MTKVDYHVTIQGKVQIETDELAEWELDRDARRRDPTRRAFDIDRYLELITRALEINHAHWKSSGFIVSKKTIYNARGIPTDEAARDGCCG
jgi:hypothetical protein